MALNWIPKIVFNLASFARFPLCRVPLVLIKFVVSGCVSTEEEPVSIRFGNVNWEASRTFLLLGLFMWTKIPGMMRSLLLN